MSKKSIFIIIASIGIIIATTGDYIVSIIAGFFYPGYNHFKMTMSDLGTTKSPAAFWVNLWWIVFGLLFIIFAIAIVVKYKHIRKSSITTMILLIFYGLGNGVFCGLFPLDSNGSENTFEGRLHGPFAGVGCISLIFIPIAMMKIWPKSKFHRLWMYSLITFIIGIASFIMFVESKNGKTGTLLGMSGLWQRIYYLIYYIYISIIAVKMLNDKKERGYS
jgi:hypothetical protein